MSTTDLAARTAGSPPIIYVPSLRGGAPIPITEALSEVLSPPKLAPTGVRSEVDHDLGPIEAPHPPDLVFPTSVVVGGGAQQGQAGGGSGATQSSTSTSTSTSTTGSTRANSGGPLKRGSSGTDVEKLQGLLNRAGAKPPLKTDGDFGPSTERALRDYQASHGLKPDGVAGPRTLRALDPTGDVLVAPPTKGGGGGGSTQTQNPTPTKGNTTDPKTQVTPHPAADAGDFCFPFAFHPKPDWHSGARYFGARRDSGKRLHAGCDLLAPKGTQIYAIADGTLVRPEYYFYSATHAVEIRHGNYIVRYGEIMPGSYTGGTTVKKGQPICKVGRLSSGSSMLHFEMYSNGASSAKLTTGQGPYKRRADLMNPTALLDEWVKKLPR